MSKKSDLVANHIKNWIVQQSLAEGAQLPQEKELIALFGVSRGTIREALKALEVQGIVSVRPGPGGGASVARVTVQTTVEMLSNYFYSRNLTVSDIYAVRKEIEPRLAEAVAGQLSDEDLEKLEYSLGFCASEPASHERERLQRISELDFHDVLAEACPNPVLAVYCQSLNSLLKNWAVCRTIYEHPQQDLGQRARVYHAQLFEAIKDGDGAAAHRVMKAHMVEAERIMVANEAVLQRRFIVKEASV